MSIVFTLFGLIIAVSVFLYLIYAADTGKRKFDELRSAVKVAPSAAAQHTANRNTSSGGADSTGGIRQFTRTSKASMLDEGLKDMLPQRTCPLCQSELRRDEPLYAHNMEYSGKRTILIYGCPYCYKDEKKSKRVSG